MNQLSVGDCLWPTFTRVLMDEHPVTTSEQVIFAVFETNLERGTFRGLATEAEIAQYPSLNFGQLVKDKAINSVLLDTSAHQALSVMDQEDVKSLPVLNALGDFAGVVTRQGIIHGLARHERALIEELNSLRHQVDDEDRKALGRTARLVQLDETSQNLLNVLGLTLIETNLLQAGLALIETNLLQVSIEALTTLLRVKYGAIGVLEDSADADRGLKHFVYTGISPEVAKSIGAPPEGRGLLGVVVQENSVLLLENLMQHPRSAGFPPNHPPMKSLLAVPISFEQRVFGRIYLSEKTNGLAFGEDDVTLVRNFSNSLARALTKNVATGRNFHATPEP